MLDGLELTQQTLKFGLDELPRSCAERQTQGNLFTTRGDRVEGFSYGRRLHAYAELDALLDVLFEDAGRRTRSLVGRMRRGMGLAVAFEVGLDTARLDEAEVDYDSLSEGPV